MYQERVAAHQPATERSTGDGRRRAGRRAAGLSLVAGALLVLFTLAGCDQVKGSGTVQTEERALPSFTSVSAATDVEVQITVGGPVAVYVSADDNLLPHITTNVQDGRLHITMERVYYRAKQRPLVQVTVPTLTAIDASGMAKVHISGIDSDQLSLRAGGSARLTVAGRVDRAVVRTSGSSNLDLEGLSARLVDVRSSGSTRATVHATEELAGDLSGSASLRYRGGARVSVDTSGSATLSQF